MAVIAGGIIALGLARGDVGFIDQGGHFVDTSRVGIAADPVIDVTGHMHDMAGLGHQDQQAVSGGLAALRRCGSLHGVDVEMQCAGVIGLSRNDLFKGGDDLCAMALGGDGIGLPIVPGLGVHQGFGIEGRGVEVVWVILSQLAHRLGVDFIKQMAVGLGVSRIALVEGRDPGLFGGGSL